MILCGQEGSCQLALKRGNKMRTENLSMFIEVARTGSISRASENLYVSQQTLSAAIRKLEEEAGYPLFQRHHSGVALTEYGQKYLEMAVTIQDAQNRFQISCQELNRTLSGDLYLYMVPFTNNLTNGIISEFGSRNPDIRLNVMERRMGEVIKLFAEPDGPMEDHIALIAIPPLQFETFCSDFPQLQTTLLRKDRFTVCVSRTSPLAARKSISMTDFVNVPVISYNAQVGISPLIQKIMQQYGEPNVVMSSSNILLCLQAASQGKGAFLMPESTEENPIFRGIFSSLVRIPIEEDMAFFISCILPANVTPTPLVGSFRSFLKSYF